MSKVVSLAEMRLRKRRDEGAKLRFRIEDDGSMTVKPIRPDGIDVPAYVIEPEHVDDLLTRLRRRWLTQRLKAR